MNKIVPLFVAMLAASHAFAQDPMAPVLGGDKQFWKAYNTCDVAGMAAWFAEDVEFYHDRGGATLGHAALVETLKTRLCGNPDSRLRRAAVDATVRAFPLLTGSALYGAVLSGEHVFYVLDAGKPERLDGRARFTHLWLLKDGTWRMTRVLSVRPRPGGAPVVEVAPRRFRERQAPVIT